MILQPLNKTTMTFTALCLALLAWWLVVVPAFAWDHTIAIIGVIVLIVVWVITQLGWITPRRPLN